MELINVLPFYGIFIVIVLTAIFVFLIFYNKRTKTILHKFTLQAKSLRPTIFENIRIRYWEHNGGRIWIFPNNRCDLYLFENCLAIVRRQNFIFKAFFPPLLITHDIVQTMDRFIYLNIYKPEKVIFKRNLNGEVDINLTDPTYKHFKIDITLKGLTQEQTDRLEIIKNWSL